MMFNALREWVREKGVVAVAALLAAGAILVDSALWIISALLDFVFVGAMVWVVWAVVRHYRAKLRESEAGRKMAIAGHVEAERQLGIARLKLNNLKAQASRASSEN